MEKPEEVMQPVPVPVPTPVPVRAAPTTTPPAQRREPTARERADVLLKAAEVFESIRQRSDAKRCRKFAERILRGK